MDFPGLTTPQKVRTAYNMPPMAKEGSKDALERGKTFQAVYATLTQHWSPADREKFELGFEIPLHKVQELDCVQGQTCPKSHDVDCKTSRASCMEANLDVQYMMAMSPYSKMGFYFMKQGSSFEDFLVSIAKLEDPPHIISISYGEPEAAVTGAAIRSFDAQAMKLSAQGITLVASSGDDGAAGKLDRQPAGHPNCDLSKQWGLQVNFPASSQWVTGVGGTMGIAGPGPINEIACQTNSTALGLAPEKQPTITTGGGYSSKVPIPDFQKKHVKGTKRGVPDIALNAHGYTIVVGGSWLAVDGTSASAPVFAGMLSLVNARRKADGKPLVGFLNPAIYKYSEAFKDITVGDNKCGAKGVPCCGGYDATKGWDPLTGLGAPDFRKLEALLTL